MRKKITISVFLIAVISFLYSVSFSGCTEDNPISPGETVKFSRDIMPVLEANCNFPGCHNSTDKLAGIDLSSWHSIMINGSNFGTEIVPYNSKWSHLVWHINRVDTNISVFSEPVMPGYRPPYTNGEPLSRGIVELIVRWINEGAKNDAGEVAFADARNKALITNQQADYVAVVNLDNNRLIRYIDVGGRDNSTSPLDAPHVIIIDNQGRYFYVSLIQEGYMEKYDAITYERLGRIFIGTSPAHIVISNDGSKGYITDFTAIGSIKVFDTGSMTMTGTISDFRMNAPHGLRLSHNGDFLFMATQVSELLYVIRTSDNEIETVIPVDPTVPPNGTGTTNFYPYQVAVTPDDRYVFVTCRKANQVRIFDVVNRVFIQNINVGLNPLALEISPDGNWCYVPNQASNSVTVIDVNTRSVVRTIPNVGAQPHFIDFSADGHYAYVTCESTTGGFVHHSTTGSKRPGTTAVIDVWAGHNKIKDIEMASFPAGVCITPGLGN